MSSKSTLTYAARAQSHPHAVARKLFKTAEEKQSNLIVSADVRTSKELLELADQLGPYIALLKTHVDIVSDFNLDTIEGLKRLKAKHNFMIFEDRKFIDIGNTVQLQYHEGLLRISEWADVVNASALAGPGIAQAMSELFESRNFPYKGERAVLMLAEMTTEGSLAMGTYTETCIDIARTFPTAVIGFVATRHFNDVKPDALLHDSEDMVVFTTGVNMTARGDALGQRYQTPASAISRGSDFFISGRGIYASEDPVKAAKAYRDDGWSAYLARIVHRNCTSTNSSDTPT